MTALTIFYLKDCPYCHSAKRAVQALLQENPAYAALDLNWIEEREEPNIAAQYDYYYVPSVFIGEKKLYECDPAENDEAIKARIRAAFDAALA